jgi:hypothetical protein
MHFRHAFIGGAPDHETFLSQRCCRAKARIDCAECLQAKTKFSLDECFKSSRTDAALFRWRNPFVASRHPGFYSFDAMTLFAAPHQLGPTSTFRNASFERRRGCLQRGKRTELPRTARSDEQRKPDQRLARPRIKCPIGIDHAQPSERLYQPDAAARGRCRRPFSVVGSPILLASVILLLFILARS